MVYRTKKIINFDRRLQGKIEIRDSCKGYWPKIWNSQVIKKDFFILDVETLLRSVLANC
jgi:hypothetical protein